MKSGAKRNILVEVQKELCFYALHPLETLEGKLWGSRHTVLSVYLFIYLFWSLLGWFLLYFRSLLFHLFSYHFQKYIYMSFIHGPYRQPRRQFFYGTDPQSKAFFIGKAQIAGTVLGGYNFFFRLIGPISASATISNLSWNVIIFIFIVVIIDRLAISHQSGLGLMSVCDAHACVCAVGFVWARYSFWGAQIL